MKYLSVEQVVAIHEALLEKYGGEEGGGHRGEGYEGVEAAVQAVRNSYYESTDELGASYAVYIIQGHVFMDGNKRTGLAAMLTFLELNGERKSLPDAVRVMVELQRLAEDGARTGELIGWLIARLT